MDYGTEDKKAFAKAWLQLDNPFQAALSLFPDSAGIALQLAHLWINDPEVKIEKERLLNDGGAEAKTVLPSKEKQALAVWALANDEKRPTEERLKAHRLYAELRSFIEKPAAAGGTNILNQGVMIIKDHGSDEEWERRASEQQQQLISPAKTIDGDATIN